MADQVKQMKTQDISRVLELKIPMSLVAYPVGLRFCMTWPVFLIFDIRLFIRVWDILRILEHLPFGGKSVRDHTIQ